MILQLNAELKGLSFLFLFGQKNVCIWSLDTKRCFCNPWASCGQSWMVGVAKAYRASPARSKSLRLHWKRSTWPSSWNRLNAWILFVFLYYESMMQILCLKPSSFCANKPSLYSHHIVGILIKLIFFGIIIIIIIIIIYLFKVDLIYNNFVYNKYNKK